MVCNVYHKMYNESMAPIMVSYPKGFISVIRKVSIMKKPNETVTVVSVGTLSNVGILDTARSALIEGASKTGDLIKGYAAALCEVFNRKDSKGTMLCAWYDLVGAERKGIKAERAQFVQACINAGFVKPGTTDKPSATVDVYWQRVKEASGFVPKGRVSGTVDIDAKTLSELKTIINRILKNEEDGTMCAASDYKGALMDVHEGLGGDNSTLGK